MPNTNNLNLVVTDDDSELFENWRNDLNGTSDSNMTKIDEFAGKFVGGSANQYLKKKSSEVYDNEWETPDSSPTQNSNKLITSDAVYKSIESAKEDIDNGKKVIVVAAGDVTQVLSPDIFYEFSGELTSLSITLGTDKNDRENEYKGQFSTGTTVPSISFPEGIAWIGSFPTIAVNKTYQFSILNKIGVITGV